MEQIPSFVSEILILHNKKYIDYESALGKSSRTAWKYTQYIPKIKQLLNIQSVMSNVCGVPISCYQLLIDPMVTWDKPTWTYHDNIKRFCNQNAMNVQAVSDRLQIEYSTLRRQLREPLTMDCRVLIEIANLLQISIDNLLSKELMWDFGKSAPQKKRYSKVLAARSRVVDIDKMLNDW